MTKIIILKYVRFLKIRNIYINFKQVKDKYHVYKIGKVDIGLLYRNNLSSN